MQDAIRRVAHHPNRSFPRKREPSGRSAIFLGPRFRGDERKFNLNSSCTKNFFLTKRTVCLILPPSLPPRGRCLDRLDHVGRERRPRRSGPARQDRLRGKRTRPSRGSPPPPLRHYDRSALEAEKAWNGDLQTPCGSAGEARLYNASANPALPHPSSRPGRQRPGGGSGMGESQTGSSGNS